MSCSASFPENSYHSSAITGNLRYVPPPTHLPCVVWTGDWVTQLAAGMGTAGEVEEGEGGERTLATDRELPVNMRGEQREEGRRLVTHTHTYTHDVL